MKRILRYIFELRFLPNISSFLFDNETWLRLRPIKKFFHIIDPHNQLRIIDVGAGSGRLERRIKRPDIFIYDTNENSINIAKQFFKNTKVGTGTNIEYVDDFFNWSISIHTLEHIPQNKREDFFLEMIRIAKDGVFINFPEGEYATKLCENYLRSLEMKNLEPNKWTVEHLDLGLPKIEELELILQKQNKFEFKYKLVRNYKAENLYWTRLRTSKYAAVKYLLAPFLSIYKYLLVSTPPSVEIILVGSKNKRLLNNIMDAI